MADVTADTKSGSSRGSTVLGSNNTRSSSILATTGGFQRRSLSITPCGPPGAAVQFKASDQEGRVSPGRLPPPMAERDSSTSAGHSSRSSHPMTLSLISGRGLRNHSPNRDFLLRFPFEIMQQRGRKPGQAGLVYAHRPRQRMAGQSSHQLLFAHHNSRLRASQQLVAGKENQAHARAMLSWGIGSWARP